MALGPAKALQAAWAHALPAAGLLQLHWLQLQKVQLHQVLEMKWRLQLQRWLLQLQWRLQLHQGCLALAVAGFLRLSLRRLQLQGAQPER